MKLYLPIVKKAVARKLGHWYNSALIYEQYFIVIVTKAIVESGIDH